MKIISNLKNIKLSPQKFRLIINLIKGKNILNALNILNYNCKKGSFIIKKILKSMIFSINKNINNNLYIINEIYIGKSRYLKRNFPRAKGRSDKIYKRFSNIHIKINKFKK